MKYGIKEVFFTLQGEGVHTGTPAVFLRFAGCNLWSGREADRERDAARSGSSCPKFCDTDFVGGDRLLAAEVVARVVAAGAGPLVPVVITGGEPLLQLDTPLLDALHDAGVRVHVETNGTVAPKAGVLERIDWVCMSPKVAPTRLLLPRCHEVKVVAPSYDPALYAAFPADHRFVQPEDGPNAVANTAAVVVFVLANPGWRISVQTHKLLGVP